MNQTKTLLALHHSPTSPTLPFPLNSFHRCWLDSLCPFCAKMVAPEKYVHILILKNCDNCLIWDMVKDAGTFQDYLSGS